MNADPLEKRLARLQPRALPASWRRDVLAAAQLQKRGPDFFSWLPSRWPTAAFATAWLMILMLRLNTPAVEMFEGPGISAQAFAQAHREKQSLIASLDKPASAEPEAPDFTPPGYFRYPRL